MLMWCESRLFIKKYMRSFILYYLYIQHHVNPAGLILSMGIAWIEAKTDFYNIDLDQQEDDI